MQTIQYNKFNSYIKYNFRKKILVTIAVRIPERVNYYSCYFKHYISYKSDICIITSLFQPLIT